MVVGVKRWTLQNISAISPMLTDAFGTPYAVTAHSYSYFATKKDPKSDDFAKLLQMFIENIIVLNANIFKILTFCISSLAK